MFQKENAHDEIVAVLFRFLFYTQVYPYLVRKNTGF